jgi:hypothetical protein
LSMPVREVMERPTTTLSNLPGEAHGVLTAERDAGHCQTSVQPGGTTIMDGDQFIPPPPPPEEPGKRKTGVRKIAATALLSVGLLAGTGVGSFVIAHAASSTPASSSAANLTASTATPSTTTPATKTPSTTTKCPNLGGSTSTTG